MSTQTNRERLAEITGISIQEQNSIWKQVKDNQKLLEGCLGPHRFDVCLDRRTKEPIANPTPAQRFGCYWRCSFCGGMVDTLAKNWYNKGLEHAKRLESSKK